MPRRIFRSRAYQFAQDPELLVTNHVVGQSRRQLPRDALRVDGLCGLHRPLLQEFPPVRDLLLDLTTPLAIGLLIEKRE